MRPLITVIVPVYNGAKLISQCLNALHKQSFTRFVCYVINDGSTDQTYNTVKTIAQYDPRFIIINKVNGGASSARNHGLYKVQTKYVTFLDCNDIPLPHMLEKLYNMAENSNADIAIASFAYSNNYDEKSIIDESAINYINLSNIDAINKMLLADGVSQKMPCKLFRYSTILDVFFDEKVHINEDALFLISAFRRASIVVYTEQIVNIRKNFDYTYPKGSAGKRRLSALNASLYIMKGLDDLDNQTQLNGVYYTVNNALKVAIDLYKHKSSTSTKAKKLSSDICKHYLKTYLGLKNAIKSRKLFCLLLAWDYSVFSFVYIKVYKKYRRIKLAHISRHNAKGSLPSKENIKELMVQRDSLNPINRSWARLKSRISNIFKNNSVE